jgi:hypothetical protein
MSGLLPCSGSVVNPEGGIEAWLVTGYPFDELELTHE